MPSSPVPATGVLIRQLAPLDGAVYRDLRLRALREHPDAFTSSLEEESARALSWSVKRLEADPARPHDFFLGAFVAGQLAGMVGLQGRYRAKERHNATVVGMYAAPEHAGLRLGGALMDALLARARALPELLQLDLTVTAGNARAEALYRNRGFVEFGRLERAIRVGDTFYAKVHMLLVLR